MLRVIDYQDCENVECEFGDYLPFKIWQNLPSNGRNVYWRTGNFKSTLLELEIDRITSQIVSMSLVLPGKVENGFPELNIPGEFRSLGFPRVAIDEWPDNGFKDEVGAFNIFVDSNRLLIAFSDELLIKSVISKGDVVFCVDSENHMVAILVNNLNESELEEFKKLCN
ncbi:hypothetical protein [Massilia sp. BJB1822]|uniref:hypothetical protein n=1 Tax=Massilia sp. BJB1822 TaxID=2744470 RepID=UPI0015936047|nr:hypothetical protein [Massilia sp. BJB1822]NVE01682.1 hypothetical protein [Massilia sp. BJB1822]